MNKKRMSMLLNSIKTTKMIKVSLRKKSKNFRRSC